jgi:hypothetical protein
MTTADRVRALTASCEGKVWANQQTDRLNLVLASAKKELAGYEQHLITLKHLPDVRDTFLLQAIALHAIVEAAKPSEHSTARPHT